VATHLALALDKAGHNIQTIFSAREESAESLAKRVNSGWTTSLEELDNSADFYIVSVKDNVLEDVLSRISIKKGILTHTTGSAGMDMLATRFREYGVLYPFQTFRKEHPMDMSHVPLLVEGSSPEVLDKIKDLALSISDYVVDFNSDQRMHLHLTAAFACNFTNYMVSVAETILEEHRIDRALLQPLIEETFRKFSLGPAASMQTGPAIRGDTKTLKKHTDLLKNHPEWQKLYIFMSQLIQKNDKL
jgi:predicted short-subunit dehydrogenase-like oxidoreductase (DUF2520 family)